MNTTFTKLSGIPLITTSEATVPATVSFLSPSGSPLRNISAGQMTLGSLYMQGGFLKFVTGLELSEDGYITIRWDGGSTKCEANAMLQVK